MRLTLRTLLAYVDDILEPAQAREIGQKIKESEVARQLLARVKEAVRKRRLGAPDVEGPDAGLDPNTVAEYLDSTLVPTGVVDVERVCLESDVHLAEVAACHQILTLVLGEPVEVSERSRERVYALGPLDHAPQLDVEGNGRDHSPEPPPTRPAPPEDEGFESRIPDYLRSESSWGVMPFVIAAVLVIGWIGLISYDSTLNPFRSPKPDGDAVTATDGDDSGRSDIEPNPVPEPRPLPDDPDNGPPPAPNGGNDRDPVGLPPTEGIDPKPPADEPGLDPVPGVPVAGVDDPPTVSPTPDPADLTPPETPIDPPAPDPTGQPLKVEYTSLEGVVLNRDATAEMPVWGLMPERATLHVGEGVVVPEPFTGRFELDRRLEVTVRGGSRLFAGEPVDDAILAVTLERGRLVLSRPAADPDAVPADVPGAPGDPVVCLLNVLGRRYAIRLDEPGTVCGIEVGIGTPTIFEEPVAPEGFPAGVLLHAGKVAVLALDREPVRNADGTDGRLATMAEPGFRLSLSPADWPTPTVGADAVKPLPIQLPGTPEWLSGPGSESATLKRARTQFERSFAEVGSAAESLHPAVDDDNPEVARFAVAALGLCEDGALLVDALATTRHPEAREAAIVGLREWIASRPVEDVRTELEEELQTRYPVDVAADVYRMLWGFDAEDARNERISKTLVDGLAHTDDTIRHLAFFHLVRLTGKDLGYLPHNLPAQRAASVARWRKLVEGNGGTLVK